MNQPNWTILYNINCGDWIGTAWEFYNKEEDAQKRYKELAMSEKYCPTKRPYRNSSDYEHLGAAHKFGGLVANPKTENFSRAL